jgi:undecaprenyl pyrophosphate synthase
VPSRWKPPKSERTDAETLRRKKELVEKLAFAVEYGTEDEFVVAVKEFKPDVEKEELKDWITRFHAARREKRGL